MSKDVYVRNIPPETTEEELRKLFSVVGKVSHIHMGVDSKQGQSKGYAFIKMSSEAEAKDAVRTLDETLVHNRLITVEAARPKSEGTKAMTPEKPRTTPKASKRPPFKKR